MAIDQTIRAIVRGAYDQQKLRIATGLRLVANFRSRDLGIAPGESEDDIDDDDEEGAEAKEILKEIRAEYDRITDRIAGDAVDDETTPAKRVNPKNFKGEELIDSWARFALADQYFSVLASEKRSFRLLAYEVERHPLWERFLKDIKGIGPAMAGVILSEIDVSIPKHVSGLWKYAGLDVAPDGAGRSRRKEHLIDKEYTNSDGELDTRKSITFNPWLKTKLMGVLANLFVKMGTPKYRAVYDAEKARLEVHPKYGTHNDKVKDERGKRITYKGRRNDMAKRKMVKVFLQDLWDAWREILGLPFDPNYTARVWGAGLAHELDGTPGKRIIHPDVAATRQ